MKTTNTFGIVFYLKKDKAREGKAPIYLRITVDGKRSDVAIKQNIELKNWHHGKDGSWERMWQALLDNHKHLLDLSSIQLDGTHTPAKRGGDAVGYQGRKKCSTINLLIIADNQGTQIACSEPVSGNHNDAYNLVDTTDKMFSAIKASNIRIDGLFLNADTGFDVSDVRQYCMQNEIIDNIDVNKRNGCESETIFDEMLYKCRFVIERTNAWLDGFKSLLVRFETNKYHWKALHLLAFSVILLRRL